MLFLIEKFVSEIFATPKKFKFSRYIENYI